MPKLPYLPKDNGTLLALGAVGVVAAVGAAMGRKGSANADDHGVSTWMYETYVSNPRMTPKTLARAAEKRFGLTRHEHSRRSPMRAAHTREWYENEAAEIINQATLDFGQQLGDTGSANHLVVGEKVKLSDDALAVFQGRDYRDARGKPYDKSYRAFVKHVVPTGYWVRKPGRPHSDLDYFGDRDLVAFDSKTRKFPGTGYRGVTPSKGAKNVVRLGDKKEVVLVLETSGGKYKIEVTQDPKYPQRPYGYTGYTSRKSTSVGSGMGLDDLLPEMARKMYYSAALDGNNYYIRHDTIGFKDFWVKANGPNAVADAKKNRKTKTKGSRAVSNSLQKRIELANRYIDWAVTNDVRGTGYFGSTWPVVIEYGEPIKMTHGNNRATVRYKEWTGSKSKPHKEVYGLNDEQRVGDLRHEISTYIIKAIKNGAKDDGLKVPGFK